MRHIFKKNESGEYKTAEGVGYDCKCVKTELKIPNGWRKSLEEALKVAKKVEKKTAEPDNEQVDTQAG